MIPLQDLLIFAAAALLMVLTPGPNMIYLISRSICQGRAAGVTSLLGVVAGFFVHLFAAAAGLTAVFAAGIASWFVNNPTWLAMQRYFMGFVLSALALRLMLEQKRMA